MIIINIFILERCKLKVAQDIYGKQNNFLFLIFIKLETQWAEPVSLTFHSVLRKRYTGPTRNKNCLWWSCLLTDRDQMNNLYRGPSIDAPYQVSVHLPMRFKRTRFLRNRPIGKKNCLWLPCLFNNELGRNEHSLENLPYQVLVHLTKRFQRRRFFFRN